MTFDELVKELKKHGPIASACACNEAHGNKTWDDKLELRAARQSGAHAMREGAAVTVERFGAHANIARAIRELEID